jgi:6-pyruvoyl-tetrahydropterin synthase related domain
MVRWNGSFFQMAGLALFRTNLVLERTDLKPALTEQPPGRLTEAGGSPETVPLFPRPLRIVMITAFAVVAPFFLLGILAGHDFDFHITSWMEVVIQWKQGILYPRWAALAHFGYGEARFIFYPPASWVLGAALGVILPWKLVPGAYVWLALTLSGCSMFLLARRWLDGRDAIFAAALYAANPYYLVIVYWRSALAELLAGALLPLLLLFVLRADEKGSRAAISLGLIVAAAWLTNAPVAVLVNYSLALLVVVLAIVRRSPRVLLVGATAVLLGTALAAFYLLPAAYEQRWINITELFAPGMPPQDNFLFTAIGNAGHDAFNRLLTMTAMSEIAVLALATAFARRWRQAQREAFWALLGWAGAATLLMFSLTSIVWNHLPKLRFLQFPWRWLLCLNVAFALLVAIAWRHKLVRWAICVAMLTVLVFGAVRIQRPWKETATDIAEREVNLRKGRGYKGPKDYVPADADANAIKRDAEPVALEGDGQVDIQVQHWDAESRIFTANVSKPGNLVLRLFNYPAWRVEVNGQVVESKTREITGQMIIPVEAGENRVRVSFVRTWDRTLGGMISAGMILVLAGGTIFRRRYASRI